MGFLLLALVGFAAVCSVRGNQMEVCQPRNHTYKIGDSKQCDKYFDCTKNGKGETLERLCPDGFMFSLEITDCDYPHNVNCTKRPALQPSQSKNPDCPRSNGFYEYPASESCQKFNHCLEGVAYEKTCPEGVIFDPAKGACIHPDMSRRPECAAKQVLNFTCPNSIHRFTKLKFGDHDRHAHPEDCRKFLICLKNGKPRVGGCPLGKVFNDASGFCDSPKNVPNCKNYYGKKNPEELAKQSESDVFNFGSGNEAKHFTEQSSSEETQEETQEEVKGQAQKSQSKGRVFKGSKRFAPEDSEAAAEVSETAAEVKQPEHDEEVQRIVRDVQKGQKSADEDEKKKQDQKKAKNLAESDDDDSEQEGRLY